MYHHHDAHLPCGMGHDRNRTAFARRTVAYINTREGWPTSRVSSHALRLRPRLGTNSAHSATLNCKSIAARAVTHAFRRVRHRQEIVHLAHLASDFTIAPVFAGAVDDAVHTERL